MSQNPAPIKVCIVNRNYPPRGGITGESACRLATALGKRVAIDLTVFTIQSRYGTNESTVPSVGRRVELSSLYNGKRHLPRMFASFIESLRLILAAKRHNASVTIVMTDPPFLSLFASLLLRRPNWWQWSMDLYPDAFSAAGLISKHSSIYRLLHYLTYRRSPNVLIALGPEQAQYLLAKYGSDISTIVLPCGVRELPSRNIPGASTSQDVASTDRRIRLGYCGNLGEAHSAEFVRAVLQLMDPERFEMVLSVYGSKSESFLRSIDTTSEHIRVVDNIAEDRLDSIDVHLVTLLPAWSHVCVPSKAVSAVCVGRPIMFCGQSSADTWRMLGEAGILIDPPDDDDVANFRQGIESVLQTLDVAKLGAMKSAAMLLSERLHQSQQASYDKVALEMKRASGGTV